MTDYDDEDEPDTRRKRPIDYRDPRLVIALLGVLAEAEEDLDPKELEEIFASDLWKTTTVARTIGDLVNIGAVRRVKPMRAGPRTRAKLRMTELGRAWLERRVEPFVGDPPEPVEEPSTD